MTEKRAASCCDRPHLDAYLAGELSPAEMTAVEDHLSVCTACSSQLEMVAATDDAWQQTRDLLSSDMFDGALSLASTTSLSAHGADLPGDLLLDDDEVKHRDAAMLMREIQGWLDPTDDPCMLGRFGGYEIVGIVGHGGMGIVLKGFEPALNRFVAIKVLAPRLATSDAARKRFAREAQAAAAVIHENVIAIHRVDESHGLPFLVMSYMGGVSLQKRIDEQGPLSIEAILRIGSQIAAGLSAAHAQGLVHRDIKPANILLERGVERVTITDFGLARAADDVSVTRTGMIAGTPQYMSPEQAHARPLDARSDLFSMGSVLYTMATGRPPFSGKASFEILDQIVHASARPIRELNSSLPVWFETLVDRLHQKSPDARPGSATEVRNCIDACLQHLQEPDRPLPRELVSDPPKQQRRRWQAIVAIALLVIPIGLLVAGPEHFGDTTEQTDAAESVRADSAVDSGSTPVAPPAVDQSSTQETNAFLSNLEIDIDIDLVEFEINTLEQELAE